MVGDQAVGFGVNGVRRLRRRRLDQAEHPPVVLVNPVPQVPHVVSGLRLQVREMRLGDVVHRDATVDFVHIHEKRH